MRLAYLIQEGDEFFTLPQRSNMFGKGERLSLGSWTLFVNLVSANADGLILASSVRLMNDGQLLLAPWFIPNSDSDQSREP
jgi:hypothetical protein